MANKAVTIGDLIHRVATSCLSNRLPGSYAVSDSAVRGRARRPPPPAPSQAGRGRWPQGEARRREQPPQLTPPPLQAQCLRRRRRRPDRGAVRRLRRAGPRRDPGVRGAPPPADARGGA
ncbi:Os03g0825600 [Oryza sativa Japonica Group]|uniref:Os03g0825600 protein n=1 Tax=Oryza sativa subsp. japonica TaxID=39947 RepID=A0A0P0W5K3_ORYSJ|nr:hypothetical protein EE612_021401 [Oryza sativa]BAS87149.1 Os03g0825600 [Oryza sativa Japonica Group]